MPADPVRYWLSDLCFTSTESLPELVPADLRLPAEIETRVEWGDDRERTAIPANPFAVWTDSDGAPWLMFDDRRSGFQLTFPDHGQFDLSADASAVSVHPFPDTPRETMRHLLLNQVLPLALSRRGRTVLHASAVSYGDRVLAFIGRSGAGKSTLAVACARAGASIVSDDCLVVYPGPDGWMAVPCHAGVRLWPEALHHFGWSEEAGAVSAHYTDKRRFAAGEAGITFEHRHLPIAAICHLTPWRLEAVAGAARSGGPGPLRGRAAVMALASELFRLDCRDVVESRRQFEVIGAMASILPVEVPARHTPAASAAELLCRMSMGWRKQ